MGNVASVLRISLLMFLGSAMVGMVGCYDNGKGGDDHLASLTSAVSITPTACPATTPPTDIFVTKVGVIITNANAHMSGPSTSDDSTFHEREFAGDGYPLCLKGIPFTLDLPPILVRFTPATVWVTMEGSIGRCGLSPEMQVPILSPNRPMGPLLAVPCGPNNSVSGEPTCVIPPLTPADFNSCLR